MVKALFDTNILRRAKKEKIKKLAVSKLEKASYLERTLIASFSQYLLFLLGFDCQNGRYSSSISSNSIKKRMYYKINYGVESL